MKCSRSSNVRRDNKNFFGGLWQQQIAFNGAQSDAAISGQI